MVLRLTLTADSKPSNLWKFLAYLQRDEAFWEDMQDFFCQSIIFASFTVRGVGFSLACGFDNKTRGWTQGVLNMQKALAT